jgi:CheY-like chemotaxis protein
METVGILASGIAHDFNNILGGISGAIDLILRELEQPSDGGAPDFELIEQMSQVCHNCVRRGRDTVEQLMSFSRKSEDAARVVDLNAAALNVQKLCRNSFDKRIEVRVQPLPQPAAVMASPSALEQAILNICINARDAMSGSGRLTMSVTADWPSRDGSGGRCYRLAIEDTGSGMDEETAQHIFEPFFTTKAQGKGSGLGLAMVYKIIDEHGGWVDVDSAPGAGTRFHVFLEEAAGEIQEETVNESRHEIERPDATVLIIEDDKIMRRLCMRYLEREGIHALTADDGEEGVRLFDQHLESIDAVILDLVLPKLGGVDVYDRIRLMDPDARVLLISGSKNEQIEHLLAAGCRAFLQKPFSMDELAAAMQSVLGDR